MAFDVGKLTVKLSLKKRISINMFNLFLFSIYRMKVGKKWGRHMVILATPSAGKLWWI